MVFVERHDCLRCILRFTVKARVVGNNILSFSWSLSALSSSPLWDPFQNSECRCPEQGSQEVAFFSSQDSIDLLEWCDLDKVMRYAAWKLVLTYMRYKVEGKVLSVGSIVAKEFLEISHLIKSSTFRCKYCP